eukprot:363879-Chlamydomonas_euryale.AAC.6
MCRRRLFHPPLSLPPPQPSRAVWTSVAKAKATGESAAPVTSALAARADCAAAGARRCARARAATELSEVRLLGSTFSFVHGFVSTDTHSRRPSAGSYWTWYTMTRHARAPSSDRRSSGAQASGHGREREQARAVSFVLSRQCGSGVAG